jgi:hypothetical protein
MNEKIQNLIQELVNELQEQEVGMSLSIVDSEGNIAIAQGGHELLTGTGVLEQYEQMKEVLQQSDCDCPGHQNLYEKFGIEQEMTNEDAEKMFDDFIGFFEELAKEIRGARK